MPAPRYNRALYTCPRPCRRGGRRPRQPPSIRVSSPDATHRSCHASPCGLRLCQHDGRHVPGRRCGHGGRQRPAAQHRSLRGGSFDGAVDERTDGSALRARARRGPLAAARVVGRRAVRPRRGHARRSGVRRAVRRLQLDGVSGPRRVRRVLDGRHRLRTIDAADGHERPVQPRARTAGAVRPDAHPRALRAVVSGQRDDDRVGLERHRRCRHVPARPAARRAGQSGRLVAGRPPRRRLRGAAS